MYQSHGLGPHEFNFEDSRFMEDMWTRCICLTCTHTCIRTYMYIHTHKVSYQYITLHTHIHPCTHAPMHQCIHACLPACTHACLHACLPSTTRNLRSLLLSLSLSLLLSLSLSLSLCASPSLSRRFPACLSVFLICLSAYHPSWPVRQGYHNRTCGLHLHLLAWTFLPRTRYIGFQGNKALRREVQTCSPDTTSSRPT